MINGDYRMRVLIQYIAMLARNTILFTRDGRKISNALIYGSAITAKGWMYYIITDDVVIHLMNEGQLGGLFYVKDAMIATKEHRHFDFTGEI